MITKTGYVIGVSALICVGFLYFSAPQLTPLYRKVPANASAIDGKVRVWRAISGNEIELDGVRALLTGVTCETPNSEKGRAAKALVNRMLKAGFVTCEVTQERSVLMAKCNVNGRDVAESLREAGYCH